MTDRDRLILDNLPLAEWFARRAWGDRNGGPDQRDDLIQEATLGLIEAADRYDPARCKFATFAVWWIRRRVWELLRRWKTLPIPMTDVGPVDPIDDAPSAESVAESAELCALVEKALRSIPRREADVIRERHYGGRTLEEMGAEAGVTRERVRQVQLRGEKRLRSRLAV